MARMAQIRLIVHGPPDFDNQALVKGTLTGVAVNLFNAGRDLVGVVTLRAETPIGQYAKEWADQAAMDFASFPNDPRQHAHRGCQRSSYGAMFRYACEEAGGMPCVMVHFVGDPVCDHGLAIEASCNQYGVEIRRFDIPL